MDSLRRVVMEIRRRALGALAAAITPTPTDVADLRFAHPGRYLHLGNRHREAFSGGTEVWWDGRGRLRVPTVWTHGCGFADPADYYRPDFAWWRGPWYYMGPLEPW